MTNERMHQLGEKIQALMAGSWHGFIITEFGAEKGRGTKTNFKCFNKTVHSHEDKNPSMSVNNEFGHWNCFTCGIGGGWIKLLQGFGVAHPLKYMCEKFEIDMDKDGLVSPDWYRAARAHALEHPDPDARPEVIKRLTLSPEEIEKYCTDIKGFNEKIVERYKVGVEKLDHEASGRIATGIDPEWIKLKHELLMSEKHKDRRIWLVKNKGITEDIMMKFQLGWDPIGDDESHEKEKETVVNPRDWKHQKEMWRDRYIIPLKDEVGKFVNVKRYRTDATPKILPYRDNADGDGFYPSNNILPGDVLADSLIYWMEGETDMLCAHSYGISAITTGGTTSFHHIDPSRFKGKKVVICFDVDEAGKVAACDLAEKLVDFVAEVKVIKLEKTNPATEEDINPTGIANITNGDFVDFMKINNWNPAVFDTLVSRTKAWVSNRTKRNESERYRISLGDCDKPMYHDQLIECVARVEEMQDSAYFQYPISVEAQCERLNELDKRCTPYCARCPMDIKKYYNKTEIFDLTDEKKYKMTYREILAMVDTNDSRQREVISTILGVPSKCTMIRYTPRKVGRLYEAILVPDKDEAGLIADLTTSDSNKSHRAISPNKAILGYIKTTSTNVVPCKTYLFSGRPLNHPKTQQSIFFIDGVEPLQNSIEGFELDPHKIEMMNIFQVKDKTVDGVQNKLNEIYKEFEHLTGIIGRRDIFLVCDLVMHSVDSFKYDQSPMLERGWVEGMILGQSRTAKSYVAKFIHQHYKMGEFISASMLTRSGMIGGSAVAAGGRRHLKWGAMPRNNRGQVTIDEFSSISIDVIMSMVDMRTSGRAQISGISSGTVESRVRSLSLSNPRREGRESMDSDYDMDDGVREYMKLYFGKEQAMSRCDVAICVRRDDVNSDDFVKIFNKTPNNIYTSTQCQTLIKWCWSRTKDEVIFTKEAYDAIRKASRMLSDKFHGSIGLINESETHVKVARLSAAVAARLFSCSEDRETVIIEAYHVEYIEKMLDTLYCDKKMNYDQYSSQMRRSTSLGNMDEVLRIVKKCDIVTLISTDLINQGKIKTIFHPYINERLIAAGSSKDYRINDSAVANEIIHHLQKSYSIIASGNQYKKTKPFINFLESMLSDECFKNAKAADKAINDQGS